MTDEVLHFEGTPPCCTGWNIEKVLYTFSNRPVLKYLRQEKFALVFTFFHVSSILWVALGYLSQTYPNTQSTELPSLLRLPSLPSPTSKPHSCFLQTMLLTRCWEKSDVNVLKLMTLCPLIPRMNLFFFFFLDKSLIGDIAGSRAWSCRNHKCPFQDNVCGQGHALGRQDLLVCVPMGQTSSLVLFLASCLNFWTPWGLCE